MGKKEQSTACVFGAAFLHKQLQNLEKDLEAVWNPKDIEPIHRLRVTSRRLRTGIKHFRDCLPEKKTRQFEDEICRLTHTLGKARDLDIQIETLNALYEQDLDQNFKPGYRRLLLRLGQRRVKAQKKIGKTLNEFREKSIINKMGAHLEESAIDLEGVYLFTPSLYERAFDGINADLEDFISYQPFVYSPDNMEKLHAMRIAGKHLRYSMEIFAPLYQEALLPHIQIMKDIQNQLGTMHDDDVWVNWLPKFLQKEEERVEEYFGFTDPLKELIPGIEYLIEDRKQSREAAYQSFLATWEMVTHENAWENLREIIKAPINIEAAMAFLTDQEEKLEKIESHPPEILDESVSSEGEPNTIELELTPPEENSSTD
jgi:CHAD domain-containing protein